MEIGTLTIRNVPNDVVAKIDVMRAKSDKKISREEYIRMLLMQHTMSKEIQEVESNYQEILEGALQTIEKNSDLISKIIEGLRL